MIQPGTYKARAIADSVTFGRAGTGTEQVAVPFTIIGNEEHSGTVLTWLGNFANEQGIEITLKGLRAAGWTGDNIADLVGLGDVECELVIVHETDRETGEKRPRIRWVNPPGGGRFKFREEMNKGEVLDLANRIKGFAVASRQESGRPAQKKAPAKQHERAGASWDGQGAPPGGGHDDLPF